MCASFAFSNYCMVTQVIPESIEANPAYVQRLVNGQKDCIKKLQEIPGLSVTEARTNHIDRSFLLGSIYRCCIVEFGLIHEWQHEGPTIAS